ncbi:MAG: hypothetical protein WBD04_04205, partial [Candidatus Omnitrophota bacterium]
SDSGNEYEVGNQFLEMSKKDKELISEYVNSLTMYNDSTADASSKAETDSDTKEEEETTQE